MRSEDSEEEDRQEQITPPHESVQINNESYSQEITSYLPSTSENNGQAQLSQFEAINNSTFQGKSVELDEGDLSNIVRMRMRVNNARLAHSRRLRMLDGSDKAISRGIMNPLHQYRWIRDENAVPISIDENRRTYSPNFRGGLRRRRVRNAVFISMDREIGIMTPSYRALRIGRQNAALISDMEVGGPLPRILRLRVEFTEWAFATRP